MFQDYYLYEPGSITTGGKAYKKYTPFYLKVVHNRPADPVLKKVSNLKATTKQIGHQITLSTAMNKFTKINPNKLVVGGRSEAIKKLKSAALNQKHYDEKRDFFMEKTTFLSAYIKFGCVSIREVYHSFKHTFGLNHGLIRELIWRDFYANILFSFPYVLGNAMKPSYDKIRWHKNTKWLNAWKTGTTGFPIVDAGMRQLAETGYMHNRARLITSSFLIKVLLIDWQEGEKYFAQHLTDYDPASNNGNWQWGASTGADSQPYFRIFNPWLQSEEYDPDAEYIKQWIPELREVDSKVIHQWYKYSGEKEFKDIKYPAPLVDYSKQKEIALKMYSSVFK
jgi:deoxyribodipyrimidine photo-lyase